MYGGTMDNNVVEAARDTLGALGLSTLRFNFRGVGRSTGRHGGGTDEVEDVLAAAAFLRERHGEGTPLHAVGYSFGAWVLLSALPQVPAVSAAALIAPPVDFMPFTALRLGAQPTLVVAGERDDFCSVGTLQHWVDGQPAPPDELRVRFLKYGDHFYFGRERELQHELREFFEEFG